MKNIIKNIISLLFILSFAAPLVSPSIVLGAVASSPIPSPVGPGTGPCVLDLKGSPVSGNCSALNGSTVGACVTDAQGKPVSGNCNSITGGPGSIQYVPLEPIPGISMYEDGTSPFGLVMTGLFKVLIGIGALIATGAFVWAGIVYMTSEVVGKKTDAIKRIQAALLGLFILVASWLILDTINPQLLMTGATIDLTTTPVPAAPAAAQQTPAQACVAGGGTVLNGPCTTAPRGWTCAGTSDPNVSCAKSPVI